MLFASAINVNSVVGLHYGKIAKKCCSKCKPIEDYVDLLHSLIYFGLCIKGHLGAWPRFSSQLHIDFPWGFELAW